MEAPLLFFDDPEASGAISQRRGDRSRPGMIHPGV